MKLSLVLCSITAATLIACASSSGDLPVTDGSLTTCVPRQTFRCLCGILEGTQRCTPEGDLTQCSCRDPGASQKPKPTPAPKPAPTPPTTEPEPTPVGPVCGDGNVDPGEACDDGNTDGDDGCSATCKPDGAPASADTCPGQYLMLWQGTPLVLSGTTEGYADDVRASCYASTGPDRVYGVQPTSDGFMTIDAVFAAGFNAIVEVRKDDCAAVDTNVLCEDTFSRPFQRVVQVKAGHTYHVIVDGDAPASAGAYTIRLTLP